MCTTLLLICWCYDGTQHWVHTRQPLHRVKCIFLPTITVSTLSWMYFCLACSHMVKDANKLPQASFKVHQFHTWAERLWPNNPQRLNQSLFNYILYVLGGGALVEGIGFSASVELENNWRNQFFSSTIWILGLKLWSLGLGASTIVL